MAKGTLVLYTDGSCAGNPGPGGWAWVLLCPDGSSEEGAGGSLDTTNNGMELTAALEGLRSIPRGPRVRVRTDSQYVVKGITSWLPGWERRGWRTSQGSPVANRELWEALRDVVKTHSDVSWEWVKGHNGEFWNERADTLAQQQTHYFRKLL